MSITDAQLHEIYEFAVQLGKDAGDKLMQAATRRFTGPREDQVATEKDSSVDIVTQTDQGSSICGATGDSTHG
jgi:myo-inositol-1(or 4)-monophosphatase